MSACGAMAARTSATVRRRNNAQPSDSGSLVIDTITADGKMDAPVAQRIFWCSLEGLVAIALLLGGGLKALQGAAVSTGIPFTIVVLVMCYCLWIALRSERAKL